MVMLPHPLTKGLPFLTLVTDILAVYVSWCCQILARFSRCFAFASVCIRVAQFG